MLTITTRFASPVEYRLLVQVLQEDRAELAEGSDAILAEEVPASTSTVAAVASETEAAFKRGVDGMVLTTYQKQIPTAMFSAWNNGRNYRQRRNQGRKNS